MLLHRCLNAGLVGGILVLAVIISLSACSPSPTPIITATITATIPTLPPPIVTPAPTPAQTTTIYFLVDRSDSMKTYCPYTETLYQLPGFFTQVAAAINEINGSSSFFVSEIWFPQPAIDARPPIPASEEMGREIWKHKALDTNIKQETNQYEEALKQVRKYWNPDHNNVIIVLTDGTFSRGLTSNQKQAEEQSISEELKTISDLRGKVYLLLCGNPREDRSPWLKQRKLAGLYKLEDLPAQIDDLGKALFGEKLSGNQYNIKMGWITGTISVTLPGETITFTAKIATVGLKEPWIDYSEGRPPLSCDSGVCKLKRGFERFTQPDPSCGTQKMMIDLGKGSLLGFYLVRGYTVLPWKYQSEPSVNTETTTLTISLESSPYFAPDKFEKCFRVELESEISTERVISVPFQNAQAKLAWQPHSDVEPGDHTGHLRIKSISEQVIISQPITLPVRFKPLPMQKSITMIEDGKEYLSFTIKYKHVPPGASPRIFLCSNHTPDDIKNINRKIDCGKGPCCDQGQGECSLTCPIPSRCPPEVAGFCEYCVPVSTGKPCAQSSDGGWIQPGKNSGSPNFEQIYDIRVYKCLTEHCDYKSLLINWSDYSRLIPFTDIYERKNNVWVRKEMQ